jgi:hypothetical protein
VQTVLLERELAGRLERGGLVSQALKKQRPEVVTLRAIFENERTSGSFPLIHSLSR